jgi:hypothetical protein
MWIAPSNRPGAPRASRYFLSTHVLADALIPIEVSSASGGVHGVWIAPPNRSGYSRASRYFVAGGSIVTADAGMSAEFRATALVDALLRLELVAVARQDSSALAEFLGAARSMAVENSPVPIESLARAAADVATQIEGLFTAHVMASGDNAMPLELTVRLIDDAGEPLAWALSVTITADPLSVTSGPLEIGSPEPRRAPVPPDISGIRIRLLRGN